MRPGIISGGAGEEIAYAIMTRRPSKEKRHGRTEPLPSIA